MRLWFVFLWSFSSCIEPPFLRHWKPKLVIGFLQIISLHNYPRTRRCRHTKIVTYKIILIFEQSINCQRRRIMVSNDKTATLNVNCQYFHFLEASDLWKEVLHTSISRLHVTKSTQIEKFWSPSILFFTEAHCHDFPRTQTVQCINCKILFYKIGIPPRWFGWYQSGICGGWDIISATRKFLLSLPRVF